MVKRLLVNDLVNTLDERTFWMDLIEWFGCALVGGPFDRLAEEADARANGASLIIRNATYFPPIKASATVPTIALLQDIITEGPLRAMQEAVIRPSHATVFNSAFTYSKYTAPVGIAQMVNKSRAWIIPLPVDFSLFEPQNAMGLQQALSLPDGCVCWIGASQGAAGQVKGWDIFLQIVRLNPDIPFVAVFKDAAPEYMPPNMRCYVRLPHDELVRVIGACRVGLCTSRTESQHLAGIEMGACGLPMVAPPVGTYWKREGMPGVVLPENPTPDACVSAIRATLYQPGDPQETREYWRKEFNKPVIRAAWEKLITEVEKGD